MAYSCMLTVTPIQLAVISRSIRQIQKVFSCSVSLQPRWLNIIKRCHMDKEIKQQFDLLNKKLNALVAGQRKSTWVSPGFITDITGWNNEKLRQVREQKIVEFKKSPGG